MTLFGDSEQLAQDCYTALLIDHRRRHTGLLWYFIIIIIIIHEFHRDASLETKLQGR